MIRSPGSTRVCRPWVPESAELKLGLLGAKLDWDPSARSFYITFPEQRIMGAVISGDLVSDEADWDKVLADVADQLVKARVPAGHMSGLSRIPPVKIEAASVIDEENFT